MTNIKTCADFTDDHCALHPQCHGCPAHIDEPKKCGECVRYEECSPYTTPDETFPEVGGCPAHKKPTNYDRIRNMRDRDKLIGLVNEVRGDEIALADYEVDILVDHLLKNGVIVLPKKMGNIILEIITDIIKQKEELGQSKKRIADTNKTIRDETVRELIRRLQTQIITLDIYPYWQVIGLDSLYEIEREMLNE